MSFGWSAGDIIAGFKVLCDIWVAVSDGPLSARHDARQFSHDVQRIRECLEDWDRRNEPSQSASLTESLREQCVSFIEKHMRLIQHANKDTIAVRNESLWLRTAIFTQQQALTLFQQIQWPFEREKVTELRESLRLSLDIATYQVSALTHTMSAETNGMLRETRDNIRNSLLELVSTNHKLVASHLELVSLVSLNLKRITNPFELGRQADLIDYPLMRQFEQALQPPRPFRASQASPPLELLSQPSHLQLEASFGEHISPSTTWSENAQLYNRNHIRDGLTERLDNLSMRRVETIDTITSSRSREGVEPTIRHLIGRLQDMRGQICSAFGIINGSGRGDEASPLTSEPQSALTHELGAWNVLEKQIQDEFLHPVHFRARRSAAEAQALNISDSASSTPISTPSTSQSPLIDAQKGASPPGGWYGSISGSPTSSRTSFYTNQTGPSPHLRSLSRPLPSSIHLDRRIPVDLYYSGPKMPAHVQLISRSEDGTVQSITTCSDDGITEVRHSVDLITSAILETSMKPFLDNRHIEKDHKFRVQFKGSHNLRITKSKKRGPSERIAGPPIYMFRNEEDFLEFQYHLLNKQVTRYTDLELMTSTSKDVQCRKGTISILLDPFAKTRFILYFRSESTQKPGFVEWLVNLFETPKEPKSSKLTLKSLDGKALSLGQIRARQSTSRPGNSRQSTKGSMSTISSKESTATTATSPISQKASGKPGKLIKGLELEFYDANDCLEFWKEFVKKEVAFSAVQNSHSSPSWT